MARCIDMSLTWCKLLVATLTLCSNINASTIPVACSVATFDNILAVAGLAETTKVVYAVPVEDGGASFDPSPPFQNNVTQLPEVCAVKVEVQSSESSSYRFAMFLPPSEAWNGRMMTTGNGGFGGGINVSGCRTSLPIHYQS
jgi:feruloyl esterase